MELTAENKAHIDGLNYESLLFRWRFAPAGDPWFEGATGAYWAKRMGELRSQPGGNDRHVAASKRIDREK
jgi:hypothetical protein